MAKPPLKDPLDVSQVVCVFDPNTRALIREWMRVADSHNVQQAIQELVRIGLGMPIDKSLVISTRNQAWSQVEQWARRRMTEHLSAMKKELDSADT